MLMQIKKNIDYSSEIESFYNSLNETRKKCFGLQINQKTDDCIDFAPFLRHTLNNVGDPFTGKGGHLQTFKYECELVYLMAKKLHLDPKNVWGYFLSGSSLSNLHAIHVAGKKLGDDITLVTSEDAHNSVTKAANITRINKVVLLKTNEQGQIDVPLFREFLEKVNRNEKFVFCFCSGSVSKGAYDDVEALVQAIKEAGLPREKYYIHLDAALGGMITPFLPDQPLKLDFRIPEIESACVSFHKRLGIPLPGSLFLMRKNTFDACKAAEYIEDYESYDTTIPGSRDGLSPFITLMKMKKYGHEGLVERTKQVLDKANWFHRKLQAKGIYTIKNEYSPCIYFEAPNTNELLKEYHLPLYVKKNGQRFTHIFTMEHVDYKSLQLFIDKLSKSLAKTRLKLHHKFLYL